MTTPIGSAAYPANPTMPTGAPAGYTTPTKPPNPSQPTPPVPSDQIDATRSNLLELVLREVVKALVGAFVPGVESAFDQLASWAANIPILGPIIAALTGLIDGDLTDLENWSKGIPTTVVDTVALNPGKFFADAANVTGLTALWVNTIRPWLTKEFGSTGLVYGIETFFNGILGVAGNPTGDSQGSLLQAAAKTATSTATDAAARTSSTVHTAVTKALSSGSPSAPSPLADVLNLFSNSTGTTSDPSGKPLPIPEWLANLLTSITFGHLTFWWADDGSWIHVNEPLGGSIWQQHHLGAIVTNVASNLLAHPAAAPVIAAATTAVTGGSPTAQGSPLSGILAELGNLLFGPGFRNLATILPILTFGILTVQDGKIHLQLGGSKSGTSHPIAAVSDVVNALSNSTGSTSNPSVRPLPIPQWLADFFSMITFGYLSFWWADDGSWIHGGEPIGGEIWQKHHLYPIASNIASNIAATVAPVAKAATAISDKVAPAKGIGGEYASVVENLLGVLSNSSGSSGGSLWSSVISLLTNGASSSGDVVANITSTLVQAFTDAAAGNLAQADVDISTRFGNNSIGTLLTDIVGLFANPQGAGTGSIPQAIWQMVWKFINCNGLTGKGFTAGNNATGIVDNPTGSSIGSLTGYVTDLASTLFSNGGHGLAQLGALAQAIFTGNLLALIGDFFNGTFATAGKVLTDVTGIMNFFANPVLPSPTNLSTGAKSLAATAIGAGASALGLGTSTGGLSASVSNVMSDFMGTLGNPSGLGTGNVALNPLDNIPILGPILEALFSGLGGNGSASHSGLIELLDSIPLIGPLIEQLPGMHAGTIGPGASPTLLPDPNFSTQFGMDIDGQGLWAWAWPGRNAGTKPAFGTSGCVRTVRPGVTTVYFVPGTWEIMPNMPSILGFSSGGSIQQDPMTFLQALASKVGDGEGAPGTNILDWSKFELVVVPYGAATYPMGQTYAQGVALLKTMINAIPGQFVLIGHSQGGAVISDVYDELRIGSLHDRNDDLLMGVGIGNMRRQGGTTFPGGPLYCATGEGCHKPLTNTEERWWEWAVAAGTYPSGGQLDGVTYADSDVVSCLGTSAADQQVRDLIASTVSSTSFNVFTAAEDAFKFLLSPGGKELTAALAPVGPHNSSPYEVQPLLAQGDTRSFWQIMMDAINALPTAAPPPGTRHQFQTEPVTVQPNAVVTIGAYTEWMNVTCSGPAIMVGVNCFDAHNNLIATDSSLLDEDGNLLVSIVSPATTISNPAASSSWVHLTDNFLLPPNVAKASLVFDVEPAAMDTGTVFFDDAQFEITTGTINAGQLGNVGDIPTIGGGNVAGQQGIATLDRATQNLLDGLATAFSGSAATGSTYSSVFSLAAQVAQNANKALTLANSLASQWGPLPTQYTTAGTYGYAIPSHMHNGDLLDVVMFPGGGGGARSASTSPVQGGMFGAPVAQTLVYGTDIPLTTTNLTITVGAGGTAGAPASAGADGGNSSLSGTGVTTRTATGGPGGTETFYPFFDSAGPGQQVQTSTTTANASWTHTPVVAPSAALVWVRVFDYGSEAGTPGVTATVTATYGGVAMTLLGASYAQNSAHVGLYLFKLLSPPSGAQTVAVTMTASASGNYALQANSTAYVNVSGFGSVSTDNVLGAASMAHTVPAGDGTAVAQAVAVNATSQSGQVITYDQTVRYSYAYTAPPSPGSFFQDWIIGDAPGRPTTFTSSGPFGSDVLPLVEWISIAVPLVLSGTGNTNPSTLGLGPPTKILDGLNYFGGHDVAAEQAGSGPGGGGGGGSSASAPGAGADGGVYLVARPA